MTTLDEIRSDAEAIEHALCEGLLSERDDLPDADVVNAIAVVAREARLAPGGLAALFAEDYWRDAQAWARRMHTALALAAHLHHAEDQYPALTRAEENGGNGHV